MAALVAKKPRTLRALTVDTILQHVATHNMPDASLEKADSALMDGSGDGALHRVTALKALGRCELARGFIRLPRFLAATRGFLVAGGGAKAAAVLDKLRESAAAATDADDIEAALWVVDDLVGAGKLKRDRGAELASNAKQAAKRVLKAGEKRLQELRRPAPAPIRETASFAARDVRLDAQPSPSREADLSAFMEKVDLRTHPDRRKNLGRS